MDNSQKKMEKREGNVGRSYGYDADGDARLLPSDA